MYLGDYLAAATVVFDFNTAQFSDGAPITLAGSPAVSVYKNSATESTAGITLSVDYDARTGMHHVVIDTSADGTFYAVLNDFSVIITAGTVGGTSVVGRKVASFSIENRNLKADVRKLLGTAWLTPGVAGTPDVNVKLWNALATVELPLVPTTAGRKLDVSVGGEAGVDWANVGSPTTALALTGTTTKPLQPFLKNTAFPDFVFPMVLTGTSTAATGKTVTAVRSLNGAAFAACANVVAEVGSGSYVIDLAAGDMNGETVTLRFTASGCDPTECEIFTKAA